MLHTNDIQEEEWVGPAYPGRKIFSNNIRKCEIPSLRDTHCIIIRINTSIWNNFLFEGKRLFRWKEGRRCKLSPPVGLLLTKNKFHIFLSCSLLQRKKFEIRAVGCPESRKFTYYTSSDDKSKHLLYLCRVTHQFSMAMQPKLAELRKLEEEGTYNQSYAK